MKSQKWVELNAEREELCAELERLPFGGRQFEDRFAALERVEARMRLVDACE